MSTAKPSRAPCSARYAGEPARFLPKWKSKPMAAPPIPKRPTRISSMKSSAEVAAKCGVEIHDDSAVESGRRPAGASCCARSRAGTACPAAEETFADAARRSAPRPCGRVLGARPRRPDHRAVAAVHAVEIADGDHGAAQCAEVAVACNREVVDRWVRIIHRRAGVKTGKGCQAVCSYLRCMPPISGARYG